MKSLASLLTPWNSGWSKFTLKSKDLLEPNYSGKGIATSFFSVFLIALMSLPSQKGSLPPETNMYTITLASTSFRNIKEKVEQNVHQRY